MLRQLLTLLAVFAGLTAAVEPARAVEAGVETVRLAEYATTCTLQSAALPGEVERRPEPTAAKRSPCRMPRAKSGPRTVILQADRALE